MGRQLPHELALLAHDAVEVALRVPEQPVTDELRLVRHARPEVALGHDARRRPQRDPGPAVCELALAAAVAHLERLTGRALDSQGGHALRGRRADEGAADDANHHPTRPTHVAEPSDPN